MRLTQSTKPLRGSASSVGFSLCGEVTRSCSGMHFHHSSASFRSRCSTSQEDLTPLASSLNANQLPSLLSGHKSRSLGLVSLSLLHLPHIPLLLQFLEPLLLLLAHLSSLNFLLCQPLLFGRHVRRVILRLFLGVGGTQVALNGLSRAGELLCDLSGCSELRPNQTRVVLTSARDVVFAIRSATLNPTWSHALAAAYSAAVLGFCREMRICLDWNLMGRAPFAGRLAG